MTGARLVRTSGILLLAGGLGLAVMSLVTAIAFPGDTAAQAVEPLWTPAFLLVALSTMIVLFGSPVLYSRIAQPGGWMAQAGLIMLAVAGLGLGFFGNFMQALITPWVASGAPSMMSASAPTPADITAFYIVTGVLEALGLAALAVPLIRGRLQPRWAGGALALAAVLGVLSFVIPGAGMSSNLGLDVLSALPAVLLAIFFMEMGRQMLMEPASESQRALAASAQPIAPR